MAILRSLGAARIALLVVSVIMLIGLLSLVVLKTSGPSDSLLYGGLDPQESGHIVERLGQLNEPFDVRGNSIFVAKARVDELRLKLAAEGYVGSSVEGYEIFDESSGFGTTSLVQNINARRALEGELSRTITSIPAVQSARVHLVLPKRKIFSKENVTPTASVTVNLGSRVLTEEQVQGITHLVSAAVPNLNPDNVTVVDNRGNLLSSGKKSQANQMNMQAKIKRQVEAEYEDAIRAMLERVVGVGRANVKVTAQMTFDRLEEHTEMFDPQSQVVRSEQRSEDALEAENSSAGGAAGASANIPGQEVGAGGSGSRENRTTTAETINYEISKTIKKHVREGGAIERLSVAVLVEGRYVNEAGLMKYVPHSEEDLGKLNRLVKSAIGYSEEREDIVEIVDMSFAQVEEEAQEEPPLFSSQDYFQLAEYALMMIAIFLLVFTIIKPLLKATLPGSSGNSQVQQAMAAGGAGMPGGPMKATAPPIIGPDGTPVPQADMGGGAGGGLHGIEDEGTMIDLAQVEGKVRESTINLVHEIIKEHQEESANVLRGWLSGESGSTNDSGGAPV